MSTRSTAKRPSARRARGAAPASLTEARRQLRLTKAQLAQQLADMHRLHRLSVRLSSHVELGALLDDVIADVCALQGAPRGLLLLHDSEKNDLYVAASNGLDLAEVTRFGRVPLGAEAAGAAAAERAAVIIEDVRTDGRFPAEIARAQAWGHRAVCCCPLKARTGQVVGVIATYFTAPHRPSQWEMQLLELYGGQAAEFIENARHYEAVRDGSRLKDEFLATLSHEIRTPLNAVLGWSRILRLGGAEAKTARAIEAIERNSRIQAQLVEDLLDISRIVTGKMRLSFATVHLPDVIEAALDTVRPAIDNKHIELVARLAPDVIVYGDESRLRQIVWNLLTNAVRFTPQGGRITITLERADGTARLIVADTGSGIEPALLPHVFERFKQAEPAGEVSQRGLGLGLAIVRHLVDAHGGTVTATSEGKGRGAAFQVQLPLPSAETLAAARPAADPEAAGLAALDGQHILVVEDEVDSRDLLVSVLEAYGASVMAVASGADALRALARGSFAAMIADIGMPDMNGYTLIRAIRALPPLRGQRLPAVALTVFANSRERAEALAAGFDEHVAKPVDPESLAAAVAKLIAQRPMTSL